MNAKAIAMFLLIAAISVGFVGSAAAATTHVVNPGDSIQATINDAADGDTIVLTGGNYTENVVINKSVAMVSAGVCADIEAFVIAAEGDYDSSYWWMPDVELFYVGYVDVEYDEQVIVTAANPKQDVFKVESDDVLLMNIDVDVAGSTSGWCPDIIWEEYYPYFWYGATVWGDYSINDYPMGVTGAYKSDAAGVAVDGATGTTILNLEVCANDNGVVLNSATNTEIGHVVCLANNKEGIRMLDSEGVLIRDTIVADSGKRGIEAEDCADVELTQVAVTNSKKDGIDFTNVDGVFITTVFVADGGKTGIKLDSCNDIELFDSLIEDNGRNGLSMVDCDGTAVEDNEIVYNAKYGIKTRNTGNVAFVNNDVTDNGKGDVKHS